MKFRYFTCFSLTIISFVAGAVFISKEVLTDSSRNVLTPILIQLNAATPPTFEPTSRSISEQSFDEHAEKVYSTLVSHSERTSGTVKGALEEAKKKGLINEYRYYYISNTFAVEAPKELIDTLSKIKEVEEITSNKMVATGVQDFGSDVLANKDLVWDGKEPHWSLKYINATNIPKYVSFVASKLRYATADTGVDFEHPALKSNYLGLKPNGKYDHNYVWWDASNPYNNTGNGPKPGSPIPVDDNNHGTHCTGTAVGGLNLGVSPTTRWMACKNMLKNIGSPETYLGCLQFLLAPTNLDGTNPRPHLRPHVVGNSYYCPGEEGCGRKTFKYALKAMKAAGIFMSVCAGNDGAKGCSSILSPPAFDPNAFTVAASKYMSNNRASFSSVGPVPERPKFAIDVTAPGVNITSSIPGGKYAIFQGTSMATPHVSGTAILIMSACPHLIRRVDLVAKVIRNSATPNYSNLGCGGDAPTTLPNNEYGYGVINVAKALKLCKDTWY